MADETRATDSDKPNDDLPPGFQEAIESYAKAVNEKRDGDAMTVAIGLLAQAGAEALLDPDPHTAWLQCAQECQAAGNWAGAEEAYRNAVAIARESKHTGFPVKSLLDLAGLLEALGRSKEAAPLYEEALTSARESDISALQMMALDAKYRSEVPRDVGAIRAEAAKIRVGLTEERIFNLARLRLLTLEADCAIELGEHDAAAALLDSVGKFLSPDAGNTGFPGWRMSEANIARTRARLHSARGEHEQAVAAMTTAVEWYHTTVQPESGASTRYKLARLLQMFANYLESVGKRDESTRVQAEADELIRSVR